MLAFKKIRECDIFVALWCLYYMQNILYASGVINQILQLIMILMGLRTFFICSVFRYKPSLIRATQLLVIMYAIYGMIIILFGDGIQWTTDSTYLKNSLNSLLPILYFYVQTRNGVLTSERIKRYAIIMLLIIVANFYHMEQVRLTELGVDETTNNAGYWFVSMLPLVFFFNKKPLFQYALLGIMMFYILMGMKRGAIMIGAVSVIIFLYSGFKGYSKKRKILTTLLTIAIVVGTLYYVEYLMLSSDYFMMRVEHTIEGDSSGRDHIYTAVWKAIVDESNIFYLLFGHGANSSIKYAGNFAHQDWLETACNNGIVGVMILAYFFIAFGVNVYRSRKSLEPNYFYCFFAIMFISFTKTMFSMSIQNLDIYQSMLIGYFVYWTSRQGQKRLRTNSLWEIKRCVKMKWVLQYEDLVLKETERYNCEI